MTETGETSKPGVRHVEVTQADDGLRLDRWFKEHVPTVSFGRLQKLLRTGQVRVDGGRVQANTRLVAGQDVRIPPLGQQNLPGNSDKSPKAKAPPAIADADRQMLEDAIIWQDDQVIFLNKPAGLAVQGGSGTKRHLDGLLDALMKPGGERPRLVHRLDKETSGVLALARTRKSAQWLAGAFKKKEATKTYVAILSGVPERMEGEIRIPLIKSGPKGQEKMRPAEKGIGQSAMTRYRIVDQVGTHACACILEPITGRTHQLRAHMAAVGCPIVGDGKYGWKAQGWSAKLPKRLYLHAMTIHVKAPDGKALSAHSTLPHEFERLCDAAGMDASLLRLGVNVG